MAEFIATKILLPIVAIMAVIAVIAIIIALITWIVENLRNLKKEEENGKLYNEIDRLKQKIYNQQKELKRLNREGK